jgi:hypothetical protein
MTSVTQMLCKSTTIAMLLGLLAPAASNFRR